MLSIFCVALLQCRTYRVNRINMPQAIQDQFSKLKISRQARYQLRHRAAGKCIKCPNPAFPGSTFCPAHLVAEREKKRTLTKRTRRNNSKSYQALTVQDIGRCWSCSRFKTCPTPKHRDRHPEKGCPKWAAEKKMLTSSPVLE